MSDNRRPKGTGSIRQRGRRYQATYSFVDAAGARWRRSQVFDTKTAAREWLTDRLAEVGNGMLFGSHDLTVAEYLGAWIETLPALLSPKTASWYAWAAGKHVLPSLGRLRLDRLTAIDIDRLLAEKASDGVGPTTLRAIRVTLGKALGDAVRKGLLHQNPMDLTDRPRMVRTDVTLDVWTPEDLGAFFALTADDRLVALWRTAAMTGLRRSEVCGLRWSDIDLKAETLSVRRAVVMAHGRPHVKEPKTARSRRTVDLDTATVHELREWRHRQLEERLRAGEAWQGDDWVFADELGRIVNPEWVGKRFRRIVTGSDLPKITMRQLRHSHATALLRAGVHPKIVQERLGHASIAVTLDIYSSVLPTMQREAVERLIALIEPR